jgi:hypothetical protein
VKKIFKKSKIMIAQAPCIIRNNRSGKYFKELESSWFKKTLVYGDRVEAKIFESKKIGNYFINFWLGGGHSLEVVEII